MSLAELLHVLEDESPEVKAAIETFPPDVQAVVADFKKDYLTAVENFKAAYLSLFSWAIEAQNQLQMLKGYLETERLRGELQVGEEKVKPTEVKL